MSYAEPKHEGKTPYEKWKETIDDSDINSQWNAYDCDIMMAVNEFNAYLSGTPGYRSLDWYLIKAMVWTETGGPSKAAWRANPMQIGNPGDPGLEALLSGKEGGDLIMPPNLKKNLNKNNAVSVPMYNIRAGIAYLLMRCAFYEYANVMDEKDQAEYKVSVKPGDSLDRIARENNTTLKVLRQLNPKAHVLHPGQEIYYKKASMQKRISGWCIITPQVIADIYNIGDAKYKEKLVFCLSKIRRQKGAVCDKK